jgi:hypothetical protein
MARRRGSLAFAARSGERTLAQRRVTLSRDGILSRSACFTVSLLAAVGVAASASAMPQNHAAGGQARFFFYNPARTIECRFSFGAVACAGFSHKRLVILNARTIAQSVTIAAGFGRSNRACRTPPGDDPPCWFQQGGSGPVLPTGASAVDPESHIYKCSSLSTSIVCRSLLSGRGFRISPTRVTQLAPRH